MHVEDTEIKWVKKTLSSVTLLVINLQMKILKP